MSFGMRAAEGASSLRTEGTEMARRAKKRFRNVILPIDEGQPAVDDDNVTSSILSNRICQIRVLQTFQPSYSCCMTHSTDISAVAARNTEL